jgi:hypothetical protein
MDLTAFLLGFMLSVQPPTESTMGRVPHRYAVNPKRIYYTLPLDQIATTSRTHVCTVGRVVYKRKQQDGDWHITMSNGTVKVVLEIIPGLEMEVPSKGTVIRACGITRWDRRHKFAELHPLEFWTLQTQ